MITLNASGSSVTFTFSGNSTYLNDGQITVPVNSLALIIDESDMATFRKAASNDIFVSANIAEFGMTKAELESWYKANMVGSTGGGGGVTPEEVEEMIDEAISGITVSGVTEEELNEAIASAKTEIEAEIPTVPTSNTAFTNDAGYITSSALNGYATEDYVTASTSTKLDVSTFETYSGNVETALNGKQPIGDYVTSSQMSAFTYDKATIDEKISEGGIFDPTQYYTTAQTYSKTEANSLLDEKLDATAYTPTDLSNYDTKSEVNTKIEQATSGKVDTSTFNVYSGNVASALDGKVDDAEIADMATKTWVGNQGYITEHQDISGKLDVSTFTAYSGAVDTTINSKASQASVDTLNGVVTAHTANTEIHVTGSDKAAWNAKSDFSGSYNDLTDKPTIPTVPTSNTAFTNDAGYITSGEAQTQIDNSISGKVDADFDNSLGINNNDELAVYAEGKASTIEFNTKLSGKFKEYTFPSVYINGNDNSHKVQNVTINLNQSFSGTVSPTKAIGVKYYANNDDGLKECWWDYSNGAFTINSDYSANNNVRLVYNSSEYKINLYREGTNLKTIVTIMVGGDYYIAGSGSGSAADCYISSISLSTVVKEIQDVLEEKQRKLTPGDGIELDYSGNISANIKVTGDTREKVFNKTTSATSINSLEETSISFNVNTGYTGDTTSTWFNLSVTNLNVRNEYGQAYIKYDAQNDSFSITSGGDNITMSYSAHVLTVTAHKITVINSNNGFAALNDFDNVGCLFGKVYTNSNVYAIQEAIDNKVDTTTYTAYTAATDAALSGKADTATTYTKTEVDNAITAATSTKQDTLVSGTNIKTINNTSILGSGNIDIQGGGGTVSSAITSGDTNAVAGGAVYEKVTKTVSTNETYNEVVTGVSRTADSTFVKTTYNDSAYYIDVEIDGLTQNLYGYWLNLKIINSNGEDWLEESIHYNGYDSTPETYNGDYYGHLQVFSKSHIRFTMNNGFKIYKIVYESSNKSASLSFNTTYNYYGTSKVFLNEYVDELVGISTYTAYTATTNTALANKVDTSTYNTYTAATDTALASKQTTLTAGTNITIVDNVISATGGGGGGMTEDMERLISTALVDLNDRKIDASEVKSNYQKKGDYATKSALDLKANASEVMTLDKSKENELVTATALNSINERLIALEAAVQALQALHNNG